MLERDLYGPVQNYLDLAFCNQLKPMYGELRHVSSITSNSGGNTGIWSEPDEALSHTSLVNYAHLVWHCADWDDGAATCHAILDRCAHYGVGLITFSEPANARSYLIRIPARRRAPNPDLVDEFIETRIPPADRDIVAAWVKELR